MNPMKKNSLGSHCEQKREEQSNFQYFIYKKYQLISNDGAEEIGRVLALYAVDPGSIPALQVQYLSPPAVIPESGALSTAGVSAKQNKTKIQCYLKQTKQNLRWAK